MSGFECQRRPTRLPVRFLAGPLRTVGLTLCGAATPALRGIAFMAGVIATLLDRLWGIFSPVDINSDLELVVHVFRTEL